VAFLTIDSNVATEVLDTLTGALNVGGAGTIRIYTQYRPSTPETPIDGSTLLVEMALSSPAFQPAYVDSTLSVDEVKAVANPIADGVIVANGIANWARLVNGAGTPVIDVDVGLPTSDAIIRLSSTNLISENTVSVVSASFLIQHM
jgi:hypothetical protein